MSRRVNTPVGRRKSRNLTAWLWIIGLTILVSVLLYLEQTALLYVLATLGLTTLLVIVALADLSGTRKAGIGKVPGDDAAAIGTGITSSIPSTSPAKPSRNVKKR
jgi:hypothetical protein